MTFKMNFHITTNSLLAKVRLIAPEASFHAKYYAGDSDLITLLKEYEHKSFVYFLVSHYNGQKYIIYIGRSSDQSNRIILHNANYEYDELYLFSVPVSKQGGVERTLIAAFEPIYNIEHNRTLADELKSIGVEYGKFKSREQINSDIQLCLNNHQIDIVTYMLPKKYIVALDSLAKEQGCNTNKVLSDILNEALPGEIVMESVHSVDKTLPSEMVSAQEYADIHGKSVEQVKVLCRSGRLPHAYKKGRDWLVPRTETYPSDRRRKENRSEIWVN